MKAESTLQKPSKKARALAARMMAVQATYQNLKNKKPVGQVVEEYLLYRSAMQIEGETMVRPDEDLFRKIMEGVEARAADIGPVVMHNLSNKDRTMEPLIQAVLLCASWELLAHHEVDSPVIINDYLNVAHGFFDASETALLNGVLDSVGKAFRS